MFHCRKNIFHFYFDFLTSHSDPLLKEEEEKSTKNEIKGAAESICCQKIENYQMYQSVLKFLIWEIIYLYFDFWR